MGVRNLGRVIGDDGITPTVGENGNWFYNDVDSGYPSRGERGLQGEKGDKGDTGEIGPQGPVGPKGSGYEIRVDGTTAYITTSNTTEE